MISILVHGPDFASSENLTRALSLWDTTQLICINKSDWREYDEGLVYSEKTKEKIHDVLDRSHTLFLGDATSIHCLAQISPATNWVKWASTKRVIPYFGDSAYFKHPQFYNGLINALGAKVLFLLPNLLPLNKKAIPLHHPMHVRWVDKNKNLTVVHAPGRDGKADQKGTELIEIAITELENDFEFDYKRLMHLTIEECLNVKNSAHIVVDQLPPKGRPYGLGRTGTEALAVGSAVVTRLYDTSVLDKFFDTPPVIDVQSEKQLILELGKLLGNRDKLFNVQKESLEWAAENIDYPQWLGYVEKYI